MSTPDPAAVPTAAVPPSVDDRRDDPPAPAAADLAEADPPESEAQRETVETVRSISRLEESN